jgi:GT2 family glycosyltransferase
VRVTVVVPNRNGRRWLPGLLGSLAQQTRAPERVIVVDNGSTDGSSQWLAREHRAVEVLSLVANTGFAGAANRGIAAAQTEAVALLNTDVELEPDWLERALAALEADPARAAVAGKLVSLADPGIVDDAGDFLRRDGVCEQRGRFRPDDGRFDDAGEIFSACAGAVVLRTEAVRAVGGFDERFFLYLEDVDLGLRLRLAGWRCWYEPRAVARHAGGGSAQHSERPIAGWVQRNTLLLVLRAFPLRWAPLVLYRQAAWLWHALRGGTAGALLRGTIAAVPLAPVMLRERRALRRSTVVPIEAVVPARPWRGRAAGGHPHADR